MDTDTHAAPAVAAEIAERLAKGGWTVRRLRDEAGFGGTAADSLLHPTAENLPRLATADRALALLGRELWHRPRRKR